MLVVPLSLSLSLWDCVCVCVRACVSMVASIYNTPPARQRQHIFSQYPHVSRGWCILD
ncbi:hypothetical protein LSH36_288g04007 [Paralvinella palmiformis]|uniref:Secreted protein n=1 Tax=Paralvinella palmiformis TaxID=53620 RepID=A0AAD9JIM7_9ANNE|nr:hypothetical protein LSH36_288g04007 [Paralvinella palmiformis]